MTAHEGVQKHREVFRRPDPAARKHRVQIGETEDVDEGHLLRASDVAVRIRAEIEVGQRGKHQAVDGGEGGFIEPFVMAAQIVAHRGIGELGGDRR